MSLTLETPDNSSTDQNSAIKYKILDSNFGFHGVVVLTTAQLHSTKPELRFCAASNPVRDGEDL